MATEKTDFLRFSAYSMKELITRKMSEDSRFTDQIYEGSNLAILIDLVAYMYQVLVYQLNNAASESMFLDTQIYENINRLVNLIGYHPDGCSPSELEAYMEAEEDGSIANKTIPRFSYIDTGLTDSRGESICFSLGLDAELINQESQHRLTLYNGRWILYPRAFTSSGAENETFILEGVKSDSDAGEYVGNDFIKAVVVSEDGQEADFDWFHDKNELFVGISKSVPNGANLHKVYNNQEKVYSVRLNQDKEYEITFGDGIVGKKLQPNDRVYVFYLKTNGPDGDVDTLSMNQEMEFEDIVLNDSLPDALRVEFDIPQEQRPSDYQLMFNSSITKFKAEEGVEDIRNDAPDWFKTGNRLITRSDYEYWIKNNQSGVIDAKCMNNWEYLTTFYRWLYQYGLRFYNDGRHFIDNNLLTRYNCKYVDAADANNVYVWVKTENDSNIVTKNVKSLCEQLKTITTEVEVLSPINVKFDICAQNVDELADFSVNQPQEFGTVYGNYGSYLEVTMNDNVVYINSNISRAIANIFREYFSKSNCRFGQTVNLNDILNQIYSINGVMNVRTVFFNETMDPNQARIIDGLSMASWSDRMILSDSGHPLDLDVSNISRRMETFQFPVLNNADELHNRIKVVKKQLANINTIKF